MSLFFKSSLISLLLMVLSVDTDNVQSTNVDESVSRTALSAELENNLDLNQECPCELTVNSFTPPANLFGAYYKVLFNGNVKLVTSNAPVVVGIFPIPRNGNSILGFQAGSLNANSNCAPSTITYTLDCASKDHKGAPQVFNRTVTVGTGFNCGTSMTLFGATSQCEINVIE